MLWDAVECCGILWDAEGCCGMLWSAVDFCGMLGDAVECCGMLWNSVGCWPGWQEPLGCHPALHPRSSINHQGEPAWQSPASPSDGETEPWQRSSAWPEAQRRSRSRDCPPCPPARRCRSPGSAALSSSAHQHHLHELGELRELQQPLELGEATPRTCLSATGKLFRVERLGEGCRRWRCPLLDRRWGQLHILAFALSIF